MAAVGEGDPRWIVAERKDGANVNSWHWEERDLSKHTHAQLKRLFKDLPIVPAAEAGLSSLVIEELSEVKGDVTVAQRKGKMMCYFELQLSLTWKGVVDGSESEVSGKLEVPEVDHDEFRNRYNITVTCKDNGADAQKVEAVVREKGREVVRATVEQFFDKIFAEYHIGETLKSGTAMPPPPAENQVAPTSAAAKKGGAAAVDPADVTTLRWKMRWGAPIEALFEALVSEQKASMYTRAPAKIDAKAGGQFQFLGGVISGYFVDFQAPTLLKQQWRLKGWPVGVHSTVTMELVKEEPSVTTLKFVQVGIPAGELQSVTEGWRANFFDAIKMIFQCSMEYL